VCFSRKKCPNLKIWEKNAISAQGLECQMTSHSAEKKEDQPFG